MKVYYILSLFIVSTTLALPFPKPKTDEDFCLQRCMNDVLIFGEELSILKSPNLARYFSKIDEVCEVISKAQKCVEGCGVDNNPFALESVVHICKPESLDRIRKLKGCYDHIEIDLKENAHTNCIQKCDVEKVIEDDADVSKAPMNPLMEKTTVQCGVYKCMAQCNIEQVSQKCDRKAGFDLRALIQEVAQAQNDDLTRMGILDSMLKGTPHACRYLYDPTELFGEQTEQPQQLPELPKVPLAAAVQNVGDDVPEDVKILYKKAQLTLVLKQLQLTEKQDQLVDRENAKLDLEMAMLAHKAQTPQFAPRAPMPMPVPVPMPVPRFF